MSYPATLPSCFFVSGFTYIPTSAPICPENFSVCINNRKSSLLAVFQPIVRIMYTYSDTSFISLCYCIIARNYLISFLRLAYYSAVAEVFRMVRKEAPMTKCDFFIHERVILQIEIISGPANPTEPIVQEIKKCSHPNSLHKSDSVSLSVTCEGNIAECDIPFESRMFPQRPAVVHSI